MRLFQKKLDGTEKLHGKIKLNELTEGQILQEKVLKG